MYQCQQLHAIYNSKIQGNNSPLSKNNNNNNNNSPSTVVWNDLKEWIRSFSKKKRGMNKKKYKYLLSFVKEVWISAKV